MDILRSKTMNRNNNFLFGFSCIKQVLKAFDWWLGDINSYGNTIMVKINHTLCKF